MARAKNIKRTLVLRVTVEQPKGMTIPMITDRVRLGIAQQFAAGELTENVKVSLIKSETSTIYRKDDE